MEQRNSWEGADRVYAAWLKQYAKKMISLQEVYMSASRMGNAKVTYIQQGDF